MNEDKIIQKLIELDQKMNSLASQENITILDEKMSSAMDEQLVILQRLDQERLFTIERIKRIEADVAKLKVELKLA